MGKMMRALIRRWVDASPEVRQIIIGAGLAFDPLPECRYPNLERSDASAMMEDWRAVAGDLWWAIGRAEQERQRRVGR